MDLYCIPGYARERETPSDEYNWSTFPFSGLLFLARQVRPNTCQKTLQGMPFCGRGAREALAALNTSAPPEIWPAVMDLQPKALKAVAPRLHAAAVECLNGEHGSGIKDLAGLRTLNTQLFCILCHM